MEALKIVGLGLLAAVLYGIAHDQITVRVCLEYFTIGHPQLFVVAPPWLIALAWGVIATWWVGLPLGVLLAAAARLGPRRKLAARELLAPVGRLLLLMAACALAAGLLGYGLARAGLLELRGDLATRVPAAAHARFLADLWTHLASYASGILGGLWLAAGTLRRRPAA